MVERIPHDAPVLVIGLGRFGAATAGQLARLDREVLAIDDAGTVGPIGGIQQKLVGAKAGGAQWFLAPESNCDEVVGHVPDGLRVAAVGDFDEATETVEAIADGETGDLQTCEQVVARAS